MKSDLIKRISVAFLGIPLIFSTIWFGKVYFLALIMAILVLSYKEFINIFKQKGYRPDLLSGLIFLIFISIDFYRFNAAHFLPLLISAFLFNSIYAIFIYKEHLIENLSITIFGIIYQSSFATFILIRQQTGQINQSDRFGSGLVMLLFLTIWICDTAAYFWGSRFGRNKLFKRISPNKTWEGAIAGFVAAILFAYLLKFIFVPELSVRQSLLAGLIIGTFGQIGDLVESGFKRQAGVKDSSHFLPGHGGILDRFDSPLFVAPLIYLCYWIIGI